ncbi:MAG: ANTAR domain-containing protein [Rhodoferax sp.]|nr:ANTAR domain-containing protein [Rhodoferax sp.]
MESALRIVVVVPDLDVQDLGDEYAASQAERSRSLRIGPLDGGCNLVASLPADVLLTERLAQLRPDMVIVDAESDARDALEHVVMATRDAPRPIVMFTNDSDRNQVRDAVAAGVSAYVVAGLASDRIRPIPDVAMARFVREQALRQELAQTRSELQAQAQELQATLAELNDRRTIERAKALLMQRQKPSEQDAYARLRKAAMDRGIKLVDIAQRTLDAAELLG